MKKLYTCFTLLLSVIVSSFNATHAGTQGIFITSVENDTVCADGYIDVVYYCSGFTPTGTLSIELSDAAGSFASPVVIATVAAAPSGTIYANIPSNTTAGNGYRVRITSSAPAFTGAPNAVGITVYAMPQPVISTYNGDTAYCQNGCAPLVVNDDPSFVAYSWFMNGIQFSNSPMIQNNSCINGDCFAASVIDTNGCEGVSNTLCITVYPDPVPVITATGSTTFCEGDSVLLNVSSEYETYEWILNAISLSPPGSDTSIVASGENGDCYEVHVVDTNGCYGYSNTECLTVYPNPEPVIIPDGPTTFCEGECVTLGLDQPYACALWSTGSNLPTIEVCQAGDYSVMVCDNNGCQGISEDVFVDVSYLPNSNIYGPNGFCEGECIELVAIDDPLNPSLEFFWSNSSTDVSTEVCDSGIYTLTVIDNMTGCSSTSSDTIIAYSLPQPVIIPNGDELTCSPAFVNYQWYSDGDPITNGGTYQVYTATECADYAVTVTDANGCTATSDTLYCQPFSLDEIAQVEFTLYPNPATSTLTIESTVNSPQTTVAIHNAQGQLVSHPLSRGECASLSAGKGCVLDISSFTPGIYFLTLSSEEQTLSRKFVKE